MLRPARVVKGNVSFRDVSTLEVSILLGKEGIFAACCLLGCWEINSSGFICEGMISACGGRIFACEGMLLSCEVLVGADGVMDFNLSGLS